MLVNKYKIEVTYTTRHLKTERTFSRLFETTFQTRDYEWSLYLTIYSLPEAHRQHFAAKNSNKPYSLPWQNQLTEFKGW